MPSHSKRPSLDSLTSRFRDSLSLAANDKEMNKPDFKELDLLGSPVSPLLTTRLSTSNNVNAAATTTSSYSSSSSAGSVSGNSSNSTATHLPKTKDLHNNNSGELSETSPSIPGSAATNRNLRPGHRRSVSAGPPLIYSGSSFSGATSSSSSSSSVSSNPSTMNILPSGNICPSGKILKTMASRTSNKTDTLGAGKGNYGHGSIMRGGGAKSGSTGDPEKMNRAGNDMYKRGNFVEALAVYDKAISISPENAAFRSNRAAALTAVGRLGEAVRECEEAVRLDPGYGRAHQRLFSLYLRLGFPDNARQHLCFPGQYSDPAELQKLQLLENHINRCADARKIGDWTTAFRESDGAIAVGADSSPQLIACKAEALLKLHQIEDADSCLSNIQKLEQYTPSSQTRFFGMVAEAYTLFVQAQVEMALGRFENAVSAAEKAGRIDCSNVEIATVLKNVKMVARARTCGNDFFNAGRYAEACSAYGEGLRYDSSNSVLYCNRAVCWSKLGVWEKSVEDCNHALKIQPSYIKALLRRAASNGKLGRWADAVRDYEFLRKEIPGDNEVAECLHNAQDALKKCRAMDKKISEVEEISSVDRFKTAISSKGVSVVHFKVATNEQCEEISPFVNLLCVRYPSVHFFKVDVEDSLAVAKAESIRKVPTFKIYTNGEKVKEMICPSHQVLEDTVRAPKGEQKPQTRRKLSRNCLFFSISLPLVNL